MPDEKEAKKLYGLLGRNIKYSLSPVMHNTAFSYFGLNAEYVLFDVQEEDLDSFFRDNILSGKVSGMNVTVPYKIKIKDMLDQCSEKQVRFDDLVNIMGALNTLKVGNARIDAYNTDVSGFYDSLREDTGFDPRRGQNQEFMVFGAGGAGRAIALFLAMGSNAPNVYIYDVDAERMNAVKQHTAKSLLPGKITAVEEDVLQEIAGNCTLFVNATPLGTKKNDVMPPVPIDRLNGDTVIYDLVYARRTELVSKALEKGLRAVNGQGMLANQGAVAFEKWTGMDLAVIKKIMREALMEAIEKS